MLINPLAFPDESKFDRSEDGTEVIYPNASVGINRILGMLKNFAFVDEKPRWHMFLINAYTVVRNILGSVKNKEDVKPSDVSVMFDMEMTSLLEYVEGYLSQFELKKPASFVIYFPDYSHIPKDILRDLKGDKLFVYNAYQAYRKTIPPKPTLHYVDRVTARFTVPAGTSGQYPHTTLAGWIKEHAIDKNTGYEWGQGIFLLSHIPMDLHIIMKVPWIQLVESYQGIIKLPNEFGTKLVPKDDNIPFSSLTHRVFGDSLQILPMVSGAKRKALIKVADQHRWMRCSLELIARDIRETTGISYMDISKIKF